MSVAVFTSRDEKRVGEGREDDTTEERWKGERERRFCLKVTGRGTGGTQVLICRLNKEMIRCLEVLPNVFCDTIASEN